MQSLNSCHLFAVLARAYVPEGTCTHVSRAATKEWYNLWNVPYALLLFGLAALIITSKHHAGAENQPESSLKSVVSGARV